MFEVVDKNYRVLFLIVD